MAEENNDFLKVNKGIKQPELINRQAVERLRKNKNILTVSDYVTGIKNGNTSILGKAITLIESHLEEHQQIASEIINQCLPMSGNSMRIGITGVPGAGKSTFIESLGYYLLQKGHKLAVLAIDPSSEISGGSILGDKTRMEKISASNSVFIRPSPSGGSLGGVARKTRETIIVCEAAGFDIIFVETVGVGQSETTVHSMVDFFLLLMLAGAGDELQGIKRGIMEMANAIIITKADGENITKANIAKNDYTNALHLFPNSESGVNPKVACTSALKNTGIIDIWNIIIDYFTVTRQNNYHIEQRQKQAKQWMHQTISSFLTDNFYNHNSIKEKIVQYETKVVSGEENPFSAAHKLINEYLNSVHDIKNI